jgi:hypothetical protein
MSGNASARRQWPARSLAITVNGPCSRCNSGWMSNIEAGASPVLSPMIVSAAPTVLDIDRQIRLALWATKMAMVFEYATPVGVPRYYDADERRHLKDTLLPPDETRIWVARYDGQEIMCLHLAQSLRRLSASIGRGSTFCVGQLVMQVLSYRSNEIPGREIYSLPAKRGSWDDSLIRIWPPSNLGVTWPPSTALSYKEVFRLNARFAAHPGPPDGPHRTDRSL